MVKFLTNFVQTLINFLIRKPIWFFFITTLFFCGEQIVLGPFSYFNFDDTMQNNIPIRMGVVHNLFENGINYWFPNVAGGVDLFSQGILYTSVRDSSLLMLIMPAWLAHQITLFTAIFCAGFFTYLVCKKQLKFPAQFSILAGVIFQYSVPYTFDVGNSFFPMILYLFGLIIHKNSSLKNSFYLFITVLFYVSTSVVYLHYSFLVLLLLWFFIIYKLPAKKFLSYYFLLILILIIYNMPSVMALIENNVLSNRSVRESLNPLAWHRIFYSHKYYNLIPWGIYYVLIIVLSFIGKTKIDQIYNRLNFMLILFSFGTIIIYWSHSYIIKIEELSFLKGFNPTRWGFPYSFLYSICIGGALYKLYELKKHSIKYILIISLSLFIFTDHMLRLSKGLKTYISLSHSFVGVFNNTEMVKIKNSIEPDRPYRVVNYPGGTGGAIWNTWSVGYGLEDAGGFSTMINQRYLDLWNLMSSGDYEKAIKNKFPPNAISLGFNINLKMITEHKQQLKPFHFKDHHNYNLLSLMNVKYVYTHIYLDSESFRGIHTLPDYIVIPGYNNKKLRAKISAIFNGGNNFFNVYENTDVFERLFLVDSISYHESDKELLRTLSTANINDLRKTVYIERHNAIDKKLDIDLKNSTVKIIKYSPDIITVELNIQGNGILIVTNPYHPGWKAYVDGEERNIFPADHAFWGVEVSSSDSQIIFSYEPNYKKGGMTFR